MKESSPIAPNIRFQQQPAPLTTGQRMIGNILILCPLCAWISIIIVNVIRQYELGAELLWWPFPLAAEIIIDMVSTTWPVYISIIILAKLGDILEKKGVSTTGIWIPIGILYLGAAWLLFNSIPATCIHGNGGWIIATHLIYLTSISLGLTTLSRRKTKLLPWRSILKAICISLIFLNGIFLFCAIKDGNLSLRATDNAFGTGSNRAPMHNPLMEK